MLAYIRKRNKRYAWPAYKKRMKKSEALAANTGPLIEKEKRIGTYGPVIGIWPNLHSFYLSFLSCWASMPVMYVSLRTCAPPRSGLDGHPAGAQVSFLYSFFILGPQIQKNWCSGPRIRKNEEKRKGTLSLGQRSHRLASVATAWRRMAQ